MAQGDNGVYVFDTPSKCSGSSLDPNLMLALNQNGGFGGNGNWIWIMFLWMMWQNGNFNNFRNAGGSFADLASQMNANEGRQYLSEIMAGRFDNINTLAQIVNSNIEGVKSGICTIQSAIQSVGSQVGMSGLETINALQLGNATLSRQICECCCENRLAIANQTNAIQSQAAQNFAAQQLQACRDNGEQRLAMSQQTNQVLTSNQVNTTSILGAIKDQTIMINEKFCELEKREMQAKINTQGDIITQLRGQLDNDRQTSQLYAVIAPLQAKVNEIASKQPNTVPVQYPNIVAANATPFVNNGCGNNWGYGNGCGCNNGFGGSIVF